MLRRLVLIGDIHTEATRLALVLDHAARQRVDAVLSVGDIVDGPEDAGRCVQLLREHGVLAVRGNHERWLVEGKPMEPFTGPAWTREWLAALPATRELATVAGKLVLGHGVDSDDRTRVHPYDRGEDLTYQDALWRLYGRGDVEIYVGGHTHQRMARRFDHLLFLNPGTLARTDEPGFLEIDLQTGRGRWFKVSLTDLSEDGELDLGALEIEPGQEVAP